jgi:hypothetical protein
MSEYCRRFRCFKCHVNLPVQKIIKTTSWQKHGILVLSKHLIKIMVACFQHYVFVFNMILLKRFPVERVNNELIVMEISVSFFVVQIV